MDDVAAVPVQVDSLLADGRADQHLGQQRRVESRKDALAGSLVSVSRNEGDELLITESRCVIQREPGRARIRDAATYRNAVATADRCDLPVGMQRKTQSWRTFRPTAAPPRFESSCPSRRWPGASRPG
jgi:hypothetical protein